MRQPGYNHRLIPSQKQTMQPSIAMQESLKILQMGEEELEIWLEEKITQNPFLDLEKKEPDNLFKKESYYQQFSDCENQVAYQTSCFEHLMNQAHQVFSSKEIPLAEWIIGNLDKTGFYSMEKEALPNGFSLKDFSACLEKIQEFDPPGIAATNIQESLALQLKSQGKESSFSYLLIQNHWNDLVEKNFLAIQKKTGKKTTFIKECLQKDIARLNPFPGYKFEKKIAPPIPVDIYVLEQDSRLIVKVIDSFKLKENNYLYEHSLSKEDTLTIKTYQKEARWLINALEKRKKTIQKVTEYLVDKQKDYIQGMNTSLKPLKIKEASLEIGLHESTIIRAIENKSLSCAIGILSLKTLFAKSLSENISCDEAQKLLHKLIAEENKKSPLSDRELLEKMQLMGIPCARRTITKYRNLLNIPCKAQRKNATLLNPSYKEGQESN